MENKRKKVGKEKKGKVNENLEHLEKVLNEKTEEPNPEFLEKLEEETNKAETQKLEDVKNHLAEGMKMISEGLGYLLAVDRILESKGFSDPTRQV